MALALPIRVVGLKNLPSPLDWTNSLILPKFTKKLRGYEEILMGDIKLEEYPLIEEDKVNHPENPYPDDFKDIKEWLQEFRENFKIENVDIKEDGMHLEFDMIGSDPFIANSLRRILIGEVPTMAISIVNMIRNTTVMQDEVLAHRLGMIPFRAPATLFEYHKQGEEYTDENSITYDLKYRCKNRSEDSAVLSKEIKCRYTDGLLRKLGVDPSDEEEKKKTIERDPCGPLYPDILIMKLADGHEIKAVVSTTKSNGNDHARHSPVSTAFYRFLPVISLLETSKSGKRPEKKIVKKLVLSDEDADLFKSSFNDGVIEVKKTKKEGLSEVRVADPRQDKYSRNIFRYDHLKDNVEIRIKKDHQIFTVQSESAYSAKELVLQAIDIFREKCESVLKDVEQLSIE